MSCSRTQRSDTSEARTKDSTTEPLLSHNAMYTFILSTTAVSDLGLHSLPTSHKNVKLELMLQLPTIKFVLRSHRTRGLNLI